MKARKIKEQIDKITDLEHQISATYDLSDVCAEDKTCVDHRVEIEKYIDDLELDLAQLKAHVSTLRAPHGLGHT